MTLPSFDELSNICRDIAWFGLGFVQLKTHDPNVRYHFWHPDYVSDVDEEEIHDHRYGFHSEILAGSLENRLYDFHAFHNEMAAPMLLEQTSCKSGTTPEIISYGDINCRGIMTLAKGSSYHMEAGDFHKTTSNFCITRLTRLNAREDDHKFAHVIRDRNKERVCPFGKPKSFRECWKIVDQCYDLAEGKMIRPGYHVRQIEKGMLGEPSKIIEEAMELADAHEQGVKVMSAVELADLYGAIDAYREKHLPSTSWDDMRRMSIVTKRAFENGHR